MPTPLYPLPYPPLCSKVRGVARLVKVNVFAPRPAYGAPAAKSTSVSLLPAHQIALQKLQTQLPLGRSTTFQRFLEAGACFPRLAAEISRRYSHAPHARRQRTPPGKHYAYAPGRGPTNLGPQLRSTRECREHGAVPPHLKVAPESQRPELSRRRVLYIP